MMAMPSHDTGLEPVPDGLRAHFAWLDHPPLMRIVEALEAACPGGSRFVGGCVRDSLNAHPPQPGEGGAYTDIDIATQLVPAETMAALRAAGLKAVPTGVEHGTVTAVCDGFTAEITTLRADVDTDGRHATVAFTKNWEDDWRRRDFTINAIYLTPDRRLYDPAKGRAALQHKSVRFIGAASERIREDYLRILRFYRFSARYADALDTEGAEACARHAGGLAGISRERIGHELVRLMTGPRPGFALSAMAEHGVLDEIGPAPADTRLIPSLGALAEPPDSEVWLHALWPKASSEDLQAAFRLSNAQRDNLVAARAAAVRLGAAPSQTAAKALIYRYGARAFRAGAAISMAQEGARDGKQHDREKWQRALDLSRDWVPPDFPVTASQLIERGLSPGPTLGRALAHAEADWVGKGFPDDETAIAAIAEAAVQSVT